MTCRKCEHGTAKRFGFTKARTARYRCKACGATFTDAPVKPLGAHTTSVDDAVQVFELMTEGMSVRAISRVHASRFGTSMIPNPARNSFVSA